MRTRLAMTLDWILLVLLIAAGAIYLTGGFYAQIGALRISARSADRAFLLAAALIGIRLWAEPRLPPWGSARIDWKRLRDRLWVPGTHPTDAVRPSWRRLGLATLGILAFGAVLLHEQLARMYSVPDLGDPVFSMWRMGWLYQQLRGDPRPLFDANIFYPEHLTLTFSDSMLLPSLMGAPLLAAGLHPLVAYNVLFLSNFVLSALATYVLLERLTGSPRAAFIGALMYGFYPYRFEHYSHLELQVTHWMPLTLLAVHRFSESLRLRYAIAAAIGVTAQLYSSMYYGVFFPLYVTAVLGVLLSGSRPPWRRLLAPALVASALVLVTTMPLARPFLAAQSVKGERGVGEVLYYSATPADYLRSHPRSVLWEARTLPGRQPERALFPGLLPLALAAVALIPPLGLTRLAYLIGLLVAFDISLGFNSISYPYLYEWLLPVRGMRVPARASVIAAISLTVLAAFGARRLLDWCRSGRPRHALFAAMIAGVGVDFWPQIGLEPVWREPPSIYGPVAGEPNVVLAEFPMRTDTRPHMYFSLWHWAPTINGYSGFTPPSYAPMLEALDPFPAQSAIDTLRARGVTHVSINCALYRGGCAELLDAVDVSPAFRQIVTARWEGYPVRLYELRR